MGLSYLNLDVMRPCTDAAGLFSAFICSVSYRPDDFPLLSSAHPPVIILSLSLPLCLSVSVTLSPSPSSSPSISNQPVLIPASMQTSRTHFLAPWRTDAFPPSLNLPPFRTVWVKKRKKKINKGCEVAAGTSRCCCCGWWWWWLMMSVWRVGEWRCGGIPAMQFVMDRR